MKLLHFLLLFVLLWAHGECATKKWLRNTNYNNSKNWDKGRVPCLTDTAIFPSDFNLPIELPEDEIQIYQLVLPRDGGLIFPKRGQIVLSNSKLHGKCNGGEIKFKRKGLALWLDYNNWQSDSNEATPHTERIPCRYDHVEFPPNSSFYIELPSYSTSVSTVTIQGKNLSGKAWEEMLLSDVGMKEFPVGEYVMATGEKCDRKERCDECADFPTYCSACPEEMCQEPVTPLGFCCPICGGYLLFGEKDSSVMNVRKAIEEFPLKDIVWHVSYISGYVQIVLVQKSDYFSIDKLVEQLQDYLLKKKLGLHRSSFRVSGSMGRRRSPSLSFGLFIASMFTVLLLVFGIISYYHRNENLSWRDLIPATGTLNGRFTFARFENITENVEIGQEQLVEDEGEDVTVENESGGGTVRAFDNPMYSALPEPLELESMEFSEIPLEGSTEKIKFDIILQQEGENQSTD